ncbi:MAG: UDP-N-acetylmuramoyl-L-alanine--D-glutamate ligase [Nitrospirae bacterium]|nr:UDP-N-acetylmuramoyl-L-alanine--D-glutamate ligase [Nitrospirota bacterium]
MDLRGKNVTVIGLARSGTGAANLLCRLGASVTVTDRKTADELKDEVKRLDPLVRLALGGHPEEIFTSADMLVVSPGVPLSISPVSRAKAKGVKVIGELELAYQIMENSTFIPHSSSSGCGLPFLAVTGSNGKSTTTTLLDFMLRKAGFRTILGGNIGAALTEEIHPLLAGTEKENLPGPDFIVAEVSSFQLEAIDTFRPRISSILNITPDHMDRYHCISQYTEAKARIFENQGEGDFLVLNADDPETLKMAEGRLQTSGNRPAVVYFSRKKEVEGIYLKDGKVYCNIPFLNLVSVPQPVIAANDIGIKGVHNLENAMASAAMALLAGCPIEAVIEALKEFSGLEHRLEFVRELRGVRYINDSKGTNVGAVIKSIESFDKPVILIAGGRDKAGDFALLRGPVSEKVKLLVLIGEAAGKIRDALGDVTETLMADDLKKAVELSCEKAVRGDVVLLSPACASFDMFRDFEDRGGQFKKAVRELKA